MDALKIAAMVVLQDREPNKICTRCHDSPGWKKSIRNSVEPPLIKFDAESKIDLRGQPFRSNLTSGQI